MRGRVPSEDQLLDVLYEVLVQGVPPKSTLTREDVELFLHQHARSPKPIHEMMAFFEHHKLPIESSEYGADRELGELASGLQRERNSLMPGFAANEPEPEERPAAQPLPQTIPPQAQPAPLATYLQPAPLENEATGRRTAPQAPASGARVVRWVMAVAAVLALAALGAFLLIGYQRSSALEQKLDQARMQQRSTDLALTKLEQRAESLQGELKQSEAAREHEAIELKSSLEEQAKRRANEEQAIERVLGPRYTKLRNKIENGESVPAR